MITEQNWTDVANRIHQGDPGGIEQLYRNLPLLVRAKFGGSLSRLGAGFSFEDGVHEVLLIVLDAIRGGHLRCPQSLPGFIRTVAHRQLVAQIRAAIARRRFESGSRAGAADSPESRLGVLEKAECVRAALGALNRRDREILERFYLKEQPMQQICGELHLTGTQFRLYKSRAIAKCSGLVRMRSNRPAPAELRIG